MYDAENVEFKFSRLRRHLKISYGVLCFAQVLLNLFNLRVVKIFPDPVLVYRNILVAAPIHFEILSQYLD